MVGCVSEYFSQMEKFMLKTLFKSTLASVLFAGMVCGAQATTILLDEGFDDVSTLTGAGWVIDNQSSPVGVTDWYQGQTSAFDAFDGAADAYIAANYNAAIAGGMISNWLITPTFSTVEEVTVSVMARADVLSGYYDTLSFGYSFGSSTPASFGMSTPMIISDTWVQYVMVIPAGGVGSVARFGIEYTGLADSSNFVGIDRLTVTSVPEPDVAGLFGLGLAALAFSRSRRRAA